MTSSDLLLLQLALDAPSFDPARLAVDCLALRDQPLVTGLRRVAWSAEAGVAYVYLEPAEAVTARSLDAVVHAAEVAFPWVRQARASRLEQVFDTPGASAGEQAHFHYAVEMDPDTGWMPEISRWYDIEHMPGLARVPGCIRATRFLNHGHGPLSLACYDLVTQETLGSPPWLAVRGTAWSDITRPHFTHTKRTMFVVA
jgi:hypothetical protein